MCFGNSFCGCNRCRRNRRNEESSDFNNRRRRNRREESSDNRNDNRNRNTFSVRSAFDQDDFCRAVRRCDRNRNRRSNF